MPKTVKVEYKNGEVRRKKGRPKGVTEFLPRLPKGTRDEIAKIQRDQARNVRLQALKQRQVLESLQGAQLPGGVNLSDLDVLQANELSLQRQGMDQQAQQLAEIQQQRQEAMLAAQEAQAQAQDIRDQIVKSRTKAPTAADIAAYMRKNPIPIPTPGPLSPTRRKLPTSPVAPPPSAPAPPPPVPTTRSKKQKGKGFLGGPVNIKALVHQGLGLRDYGQQGDGLDPLRTAMRTAESGDPETAAKMIRSMQRAKLDPTSRAMNYVKSLQ